MAKPITLRPMQRIMHPIMGGPLESKWGGGAPGILDTVPWLPEVTAVPDGSVMQVVPLDGSAPFSAQRSGSDWTVGGVAVSNSQVPAGASGVIDLGNDFYYWNGAVRAKTDMTAYTSTVTRHHIDNENFGINASQEATFIIDYTAPESGGYTNGEHFFSFTRSAGSGGRFEMTFTTGATNTGSAVLTYAQRQGGPAISNIQIPANLFNPTAAPTRPLARGRTRLVITIEKNQPIKLCRDGYVVRETSTAGDFDYNITRMGFGLRVLNGLRDLLLQSDDLYNSMRFVIFPFAITSQQMTDVSLFSEQGLQPLLFLGDSYLEPVDYSSHPDIGIVDHIKHETRTSGYRSVTMSNQGGTALYRDEPLNSGNNSIIDRLEDVDATLRSKATLVIVDGGWDEDAATRIAGIGDCIDLIGHDRWMDHETVYGTDKPIGHPNRVAYDTDVPLVQAFAGDHFIPTYTYMRAQGAPDATLSASIAAGHSANSITGRYCGISTTVGSFRTAVYISPAAEMTEMAPVQADGDWAILTQDDGANARGVYTVISGSWTFRYALPDMSGLSTADIHDSASDATGTWPHSQLYNAIHPSKQVGNTNYGDNTLDALTDMGYMSSKWL